MKIDGIQAGRLYDAFSDKKTSGQTSGGARSPEKGDRVEISGKASDMSKAGSLARSSSSSETSADRQARLDHIKKLVDSGEYNVSSKKVARSILTGRNFDTRA